jgi:hypothetical protein
VTESPFFLGSLTFFSLKAVCLRSGLFVFAQGCLLSLRAVCFRPRLFVVAQGCLFSPKAAYRPASKENQREILARRDDEFVEEKLVCVYS